MNLLVLLTCHNRMEKTIACLKSLKSDVNQNFSFIVVDDNSSDGTVEALSQIEGVTLIAGNGSLFYSGGMRMAIAEAKRRDLKCFDYVMFINDDVMFFEGAITRLITYLGGSDEILVGATCGESRHLSYGGAVRTNKIKPSYKNVMSGNQKVYCDTFCANCVLIPTEIFKVLDNIDPIYHHAMGDFDYGCAAKRVGYRILASDFFVGTCNDNPITNTWRDSSLPRKVRLKKKESPKGLPFREYYHYLKKNHGLTTAIVYSLSGYIKILLGK